jgi:hypothetical protein
LLGVPPVINCVAVTLLEKVAAPEILAVPFTSKVSVGTIFIPTLADVIAPSPLLKIASPKSQKTEEPEDNPVLNALVFPIKAATPPAPDNVTVPLNVPLVPFKAPVKVTAPVVAKVI